MTDQQCVVTLTGLSVLLGGLGGRVVTAERWSGCGDVCKARREVLSLVEQ